MKLAAASRLSGEGSATVCLRIVGVCSLVLQGCALALARLRGEQRASVPVRVGWRPFCVPQICVWGTGQGKNVCVAQELGGLAVQGRRGLKKSCSIRA
jgi:hypothetical protein